MVFFAACTVIRFALLMLLAPRIVGWGQMQRWLRRLWCRRNHLHVVPEPSPRRRHPTEMKERAAISEDGDDIADAPRAQGVYQQASLPLADHSKSGFRLHVPLAASYKPAVSSSPPSKHLDTNANTQTNDSCDKRAVIDAELMLEETESASNPSSPVAKPKPDDDGNGHGCEVYTSPVPFTQMLWHGAGRESPQPGQVAARCQQGFRGTALGCNGQQQATASTPRSCFAHTFPLALGLYSIWPLCAVT